MTNAEYITGLKTQGIYDIITDKSLSISDMATKLAKGRDPKKVEYKIRIILTTLQSRINNPNGLIV